MSSRLHHARKIPFGLGAGGVMLLLNVGTAHAAAGGGNIGGGYEIPSSNVTISQGQPQCATFHASANDPTTHVLPMTNGSFGLSTKTGGGTATFTRTSAWYAGPTGTTTSANCGTAGSVTGTLSVSYAGWSCTSGTGTYTRTNNTAYTLTGTVTCDNTSTQTVESTAVTVTFTGTQVLCGGTGQPTCNNVNAGSNISGSYTWST